MELLSIPANVRLRHGCRSLAALLLLVTSCVMPAYGQTRFAEYEVKAAYLYNFFKFAEWPSDGRETFGMCIVGDDPFGENIDRIMSKKRVLGRTIVIRRIRERDDLGPCHVLFIPALAARHTADVLARVPAGALTVGETPFFLRQGGAVRFYEEDKRVRFDINVAAAAAAGIRFNSQLLSLAKR